MKVGILLFDGVDLLDAGGPYEVFLTANRLAERGGVPAPFQVTTVTADGKPAVAYGGLLLTPHQGVSDDAEFDIVVIPGTVDLEEALRTPTLRMAVERLTRSATLTTSVCTGAFLLARAGCLAGRPWTTHWEDIDDLASDLGPDGLRRNVRWVDAGPVVTAGGLACGIDMALHIVDRTVGRELAIRTARQLDTPWRPDASPQPPSSQAISEIR